MRFEIIQNLLFCSIQVVDAIRYVIFIPSTFSFVGTVASVACLTIIVLPTINLVPALVMVGVEKLAIV